MVHFANEFNIGLMRICIGGQFISIQKYLRRRQRLSVSDKPLTLNGKNKNNRNLNSFVSAYITRLSNYILRHSASKIINIEKKKTRIIKSLKEIIKDIDCYKIKLGIENH